MPITSPSCLIPTMPPTRCFRFGESSVACVMASARGGGGIGGGPERDRCSAFRAAGAPPIFVVRGRELCVNGNRRHGN
jgi:hypothetical protein